MISQPEQCTEVDVVIVGGGPSGSTVSSLLKKYNPDLSVMILEKAKFPREHVGESQLPGISAILDEMGVWDKVEAANFPVKLGGSYTWGKDADAWDFDFYPAEEFEDQERPAKYEGQRRHTAFQVERDRYDEILLRHTEEMGTIVREETMVREVMVDGDRIEGLKLTTGEVIRARHYVDGSGDAAILRKALGVESDAPTHLRNVAFWDYWDNAKWAVEIGVGGTRVQVRSLPYGWIWFIPLGPSRASVGLICPSAYYKESGMSPKELYLKAVEEQPEIRELLKDANSDTDGNVLTTKNWSHLADRLVGENWWICGEAAGFADPILAAGMTLAHGTSREVAYSILEVERGELDPDWVKKIYDEKGRRNIRQHIRFAEYWYAANGRFTDLQEYCKEIAKESGLSLNPSQAWRWLAQGGFTNQTIEQAGFGAFDVGSSKQLINRFSGRESKFQITKLNEFKLNLNNAEEVYLGELRNGRINRVMCYKRGESLLPMTGAWKTMVDILKQESDLETIYKALGEGVARKSTGGAKNIGVFVFLQTLEVMVNEGWVIGRHNKKRPLGNLQGSRMIRSEKDAREALKDAKATIKFAFDEPIES
ncbi:MAG: NAD(P)/FAD-dependent oxidoreductase [Phycisphaerales bacterium JB052]